MTLTQVYQGFLVSINDNLDISVRFDVKSSGMKDRPRKVFKKVNCTSFRIVGFEGFLRKYIQLFF